jgi:hypothetical protein
MKTVAVTLIVLAILLSSCTNIELAPNWVVKLETDRSSAFCTGMVISPNFLITANHCKKYGLHKATLFTGQEVEFDPDYMVQLMNQDVAVFYSKEDMILPRYAKVASPEPGLVSRVYGYCPKYEAGTYRAVEYVERFWMVGNDMVVDILDGWQSVWSSDSPYVCAGDSGGPILQNGKVVGMLVAIPLDRPGMPAIGKEFLAVPLQCIFALHGGRDWIPEMPVEMAGELCARGV